MTLQMKMKPVLHNPRLGHVESLLYLPTKTERIKTHVSSQETYFILPSSFALYWTVILAVSKISFLNWPWCFVGPAATIIVWRFSTSFWISNTSGLQNLRTYQDSHNQLYKYWAYSYRDIIQDNMLVNISGLQGHSMAIDINMEHLIGQSKVSSIFV
jgi:hypothetical protein